MFLFNFSALSTKTDMQCQTFAETVLLGSMLFWLLWLSLQRWNLHYDMFALYQMNYKISCSQVILGFQEDVTIYCTTPSTQLQRKFEKIIWTLYMPFFIVHLIHVLIFLIGYACKLCSNLQNSCFLFKLFLF